ncbi:hypothetical protein NST89_03290 [Caldifermentibacillus hisashii]|uniref:hypothetical protein n=1 Tax=Caldifermentibacillus hisashii TaxID=996558 RepID=UPI00313765E5
MTTRTSFVVKIVGFSPQNGDENWFRRQNNAVFTSKWRRELVSSPKLSDFHFKVVTRLSLVAKKWSFRPKNDDEKWPRRQKVEFFAQK